MESADRRQAQMAYARILNPLRVERARRTGTSHRYRQVMQQANELNAVRLGLEAIAELAPAVASKPGYELVTAGPAYRQVS